MCLIVCDSRDWDGLVIVSHVQKKNELLTSISTNSLPRDAVYRRAVGMAIARTRDLVGKREAAKWVPPQSSLQGEQPTVLKWVADNAKGSTHLPRKLQNAFAQAADRNRFDTLLSSHGNQTDRARILACSATHASA